MIDLRLGDCRDVLKTLADASVDSCVTDPPYELGFMGKAWDGSGIAYDVGMWREVLRVLKPGGHLLAFGGSRTYHRLACAVEDAGFEIRDQIMWLYGSGFPKSLDVGKAIDKMRNGGRDDIVRSCTWIADRCAQLGLTRRDLDAAAGCSDMGGWWASRLPHRCQIPTLEQWQRLEPLLGLPPDWMRPLLLPAFDPGEAWEQREVIGQHNNGYKAHYGGDEAESQTVTVTAPATEAARRWQGWGTALKPAHEPIVVARRPLIGTVAENVLAFGTGAINVDGCRVGSEGVCAGAGAGAGARVFGDGLNGTFAQPVPGLGRWPANVIHDGSAEVLAGFPETTSGNPGNSIRTAKGMVLQGGGNGTPLTGFGDTGSAARFFQQCYRSDEEWLEFNLSIALTAGSNLSLPSLAAAIARAAAVTSALPAGISLSVLIAPSTSATLRESRTLCESVIEAIQSIGPKFLREWQQEKLSNSSNRASVVATREPTGIMTITASHWRCDGSADPVTFCITSSNTDLGAAACRYHYTPKADATDRDQGLEGFARVACGMMEDDNYEIKTGAGNLRDTRRGNHHPTVKPTELMRYLCRLVTQPGGIVLDPFMGSGSTGKAATLERFDFIGIEREAEYLEIARARIAWLGVAPSVDGEAVTPAPVTATGAQMALEFA